jgi:hypothetical protein
MCQQPHYKETLSYVFSTTTKGNWCLWCQPKIVSIKIIPNSHIASSLVHDAILKMSKKLLVLFLFEQIGNHMEHLKHNGIVHKI